jgi:hypothetical protein
MTVFQIVLVTSSKDQAQHFRRELINTGLKYNLFVVNTETKVLGVITKYSSVLGFFVAEDHQQWPLWAELSDQGQHLVLLPNSDQIRNTDPVWTDALDQKCLELGRLPITINYLRKLTDQANKIAKQALDHANLWQIAVGATANPDSIVFVVDPEFKILFCNEAFRVAMVGSLNVKMDIGTNYLEVPMMAERHKRMKEYSQRALLGEVFVVKHNYGEDEAHPYWFRIRYIPIYEKLALSTDNKIINLSKQPSSREPKVMAVAIIGDNITFEVLANEIEK